MKKSKAISLSLMHGILVTGLAACDNGVVPVDPCNTQTFQPQACQMAIANHGYYYQGSYFPMMYSYPFGYYNSGYTHYIATGGRVYAAPQSVYSRSYAAPSVRAERYTGAMTRNGSYLSGSRMGSFSAGRSGATFSRGGFGSIGAGRGGSFGG
jgi:hypothetical protein